MVTGLLDAIALCFGGYHGYCDAQQILLQENTEWTITYAPAIVQGGICGVVGGAAGFFAGAAVGTQYGPVGALVGASTGGVLGGSIGLAVGAALGGLETLIGYGIGYGLGTIAPNPKNTADNSNL